MRTISRKESSEGSKENKEGTREREYEEREATYDAARKRAKGWKPDEEV